eukprot:m.99978 g.99978  ORF g.99978 m.99978 type:complete len:376 (+) comp13689_c1_seq1:114-1241(+)
MEFVPATATDKRSDLLQWLDSQLPRASQARNILKEIVKTNDTSVYSIYASYDGNDPQSIALLSRRATPSDVIRMQIVFHASDMLSLETRNEIAQAVAGMVLSEETHNNTPMDMKSISNIFTNSGFTADNQSDTKSSGCCSTTTATSNCSSSCSTQKSTTCNGKSKSCNSFDKEKIEILFAALDASWVDLFKSVFESQQHKSEWINNCPLYFLPETTANVPKLSTTTVADKYKVRKLLPSDAEAVNNNWPYNYDGSLSYLTSLITNHTSTGVFDTSTTPETLVGWVLTYSHGAIGIMHIMDAHRRQGLGLHIATIHLKEWVKENWTCEAFCYIVEENIASISLYQGKLGFQKDRDMAWALFTPKKSSCTSKKMCCS